MFLIRTVFWLALVVMVLPTEPQQQEKLVKTVSQAAHQAATFCDRNGSLCDRGAEAWATFRQKLEFGTRMVVEVATERMQPQPQTAAAPPRPGKAAVQPAGGTLTPDDMAPAWRAKAQRTGI